MEEIVSTDTLNTHNSSITGTAEDRALKAKHAAIWASGSYPTVVDDVVAALGGVLVDIVDIQPGQHVLDVAAGTGTSALPAARRGARVTATDLTPELLDVGRADAASEGLDITWQTADAEAL
jgi:2-polyprenyl-3-methyl-5-hydroxy-6-metoxy-1,4-benzoquinol methylase